MEKKNVITAASAALSIVLAPWAYAADTPVPNLSAKAPGTVAAPTPPNLSYLNAIPPVQAAAPKAAAPAVKAPVPAPTPAPAAALAPVAKAAPAPTHAAVAAANDNPKSVPEASTQPEKKAAAKPAVRHAKKVVPVHKAANTFDFSYKGDLWTALELLVAKQPQLTLSKEGNAFRVPVQVELRSVTLIDVLASIGEQAGTAADLIYNRDEQTALVKYRDAYQYQALANPIPLPIPVKVAPVAPPVSPIEEAKNWQQGGAARPVMGQDGLLMFPYGQSQPTLVCQPLRACDIQLQAGEMINNVILGDTVRWIPAPATTGNGNQATPHVIVKPTEVNLQTNLMITTNRRTYMMTLQSSDTQYVSRVGFYYPQEMVQDWNGQIEAERRKADDEAKRKVSDLPIASIEQLNLDGYSIKGDSSLPWYPTRVFDDGTHVWIQMPQAMRSNEAPALVLIGNDGKSELVNYRVKDASQGADKVTYYIVDKLFTKAALIIGVGRDQQKVEIVKASKGGWFNRG